MEKQMTENGLIRVKDVSLQSGLSIAAAGFLLGCTTLIGRASPLPAALICGLNGLESVFALVGSAIGFMVSGGARISALYTCALLIVSVMRFILGGRSAVFDTAVGIVAGVCVSGAGFFAAEGLYDIFVSVVFGVVTAGGGISAAALRRNAESIKERGIKGGTAAAAGIAFLLVTAALTCVQVSFFNLGAALAATAVLMISDNKTACPITAALAAAGLTIGESGFAVSGIVLTLAAAFLALTNRYGRLFRSSALIFTTAAGMAIAGVDKYSAAAAASCVIPAVLYFALPERYISISGIIGSSGGRYPFAAYADRLLDMSAAIEDMRDSLEKTAETLRNENSPSIESVYIKASDKVCASCRSNMTCWGSRYSDTADDLNRAVRLHRGGMTLNEGSFTGYVGRECISKKALARELNRQYDAYCTAMSNSGKTREMRAMLYSQLSAAVSLLNGMSDELSGGGEPRGDYSAEIDDALRSVGCTEPKTSVFVRDGRVTADSYARRCPNISPAELSKKLSSALGTELEMPMIDESDDLIHIAVTERTTYSIQTEVFRKSKGGKAQSGDTCDVFNDGRGSAYLILSDGMGSGARARIDSAFVCSSLCRLIRSGVDTDTALELLNSAMLVKSHDESFATLDMCRVDLETGRVLLYKAGSAATYVKCGDSFARIDCESLPVGTALSLDYSGKSFTLSDGDVLIMTSDGAVIEDEWLGRLLTRDGDIDLKKTIDAIGEALRASSEKEYADDITVLGMKLTR